MLSIIVPVYNAADYLNQCIDSILNQSYSDFELILVDNDSSDSSPQICNDYLTIDNRVRVFEEKCRGPFYARKRGIEESGGDYITFVDADDFIAENSFAYAKDDMDSGIDVIFFDIYRYFDDKNIRLDSCLKTQKIYNKEMIVNEIYPQMIWNKFAYSFGVDPSLCNKIFKASRIKKAFENVEKLDFHYGEDVAIIYPLLQFVDTISVHNKAYYYHRQRKQDTHPTYIKDDEYLDKLYLLYKHLMQSMGNKKIFQEQIDLFYIHSVELAKRKYGVSDNVEKNILFPFDKVNKGERIVIYGAGHIGTEYMKQLELLNYCKVVLWVDSYAKKNGVALPETIVDYVFDKIIIAIVNPTIQKEIKKQLLCKGIDAKKIILQG